MPVVPETIEQSHRVLAGDSSTSEPLRVGHPTLRHSMPALHCLSCVSGDSPDSLCGCNDPRAAPPQSSRLLPGDYLPGNSCRFDASPEHRRCLASLPFSLPTTRAKPVVCGRHPLARLLLLYPLGSEPMLFTPKGLHHIAQGCRAAATLGETTPRAPTPKGLHQPPLMQPLRGRREIAAFPRVARFAGNPGLCDVTPSG